MIFKTGNEILLFKLHSGGCDLPGGRMDNGEKIFEALAREVNEEIGISIDFKTEPLLLTVRKYKHKGDNVHRLLVIYLYELEEKIRKQKNAEKNSDIVWLTESAVTALNINKDYKKTLLKAFR